MKHRIFLTDNQKAVAEQIGLGFTSDAFDAIAKGDERWAGNAARQAFVAARRYHYGIAFSAEAKEQIVRELTSPHKYGTNK